MSDCQRFGGGSCFSTSASASASWCMSAPRASSRRRKVVQRTSNCPRSTLETCVSSVPARVPTSPCVMPARLRNASSARPRRSWSLVASGKGMDTCRVLRFTIRSAGPNIQVGARAGTNRRAPWHRELRPPGTPAKLPVRRFGFLPEQFSRSLRLQEEPT
jgi:hypothetical protein